MNTSTSNIFLNSPAESYNLDVYTGRFQSKIFSINEPPKITNVEILNPNKVVRFTFENKKQIKTICSEKDSFDFEQAFYIAYAKFFFAKNVTSEGIEFYANELRFRKAIIKEVNRGLKLYKRNEKLKEKKAKEEAERKTIIKRRKEKAKRRKENKNK